jgi:hypothetical protein
LGLAAASGRVVQQCGDEPWEALVELGPAQLDVSRPAR